MFITLFCSVSGCLKNVKIEDKVQDKKGYVGTGDTPGIEHSGKEGTRFCAWRLPQIWSEDDARVWGQGA